MGSFVGADANGGNVSTLTGVSWPVHTGDDLAILVWTFLNTSTHTDPSGFTLVGTLDDGSCRSRVYKRIPADMTGSESGDVSLVCGTINRQSAVLYVVSGFTDVAGSASFAETVTGTSHDCPQVTFAGDCNTLVAVSERLTSGTTNATAPTGYTEHTGSEFGTGGTGGSYTGVADDGLATAVASPVNPGAWTGHVSGGTAVTWTLALTPSGTTVNLGQPSETDTVSAATLSKAATLGQPSDTDSSFPLALAKTVTLGLATETDEAFPLTITSGLTFTLGQAIETDTAFALTLTKATTLSQATETDLAQALATSKAAALGLASETNSSSALSVVKDHALGLASETSQSFTVVVSKTHVFGLVAEADQAFALVLTDPRDITVIAQLRSNHVTGGVVLSDLVAGLRSSHITGGVDVPRNMLTGSVEYVTAEVTFVGETAAGIATVTGQVKITSDDTIPSTWDNADVTERTDVNGGALLALKKLHTAGTAGEYRVWAKVSDNPEVPILKCGSFTVR